MHPIFERLKERKIEQRGVAYLAGACALIQVLDIPVETWRAPPVLPRVFQVALAAGFFLTPTLAWHLRANLEDRLPR